MYKTPSGKLKKSRRVKGFIFIFLANKKSGTTTRKPIRIMRKSNMTRRDFTRYAQGLTENLENSLFHALNRTSH